jgi:hypothetical protein
MALNSVLRRALATTLLAVALVAAFAGSAFANPGGDNISSAISSVLPLSTGGSLVATDTDCRDVYAVTLTEGQTLEVSVDGTTAADFDVYLYGPSATSVNDNSYAWSAHDGNAEHFSYTVWNTGTYYIDVVAYAGAGDYTLSADIVPTKSFSLSKVSMRKSAKKRKKVNFSVKLTPGYNSNYGPIDFGIYQYSKGKYRLKKWVFGDAKITYNAPNQTFTGSYKFPKKGKWAVKAVFWDPAHSTPISTRLAYIKIK